MNVVPSLPHGFKTSDGKKPNTIFLTCLLWQCTKERLALAFVPVHMFTETGGAQAFIISDPVKHCCKSVELREDVGGLSGGRPRSPPNEAPS